jgi:3-oxoacyl-[acyl-carrier protein] reductase
VKRALVTGGSGTIGAAIAGLLARDGLHVIVHGWRNAERAREVARAIEAEGGSAETTSFDVSDAEASARVLDGLLAAGPIQVLVNNAGTYDDALMAAMRPEQWRGVVDVCLNGFFNVTQPVLLPMLRTRWGRIVTISSVAAVTGNKGQTNYAAAKAGLHGATKSLALEVASRGVTANVVAPGLIEGPITEREFDAAAIRRLVPMQRAGTAHEVAATVSFLASDAGGYISGQVINVNGFMA